MNSEGGPEAAKETESSQMDAAKLWQQSVEVDGEVFPHFPVKATAEQHLRALKSMQMREDDIVIAAFFKSGTHWVWEILQMLKSGSAEYETLTKEHHMLEFTDVERLDTMPSPRIMNSHLSLKYLSEEIVTKKIPVVHMLRNPKDTVVSFHHHRQQMKDVKEQSFTEFAEEFLKGGITPGSYRDYFCYLPDMEKWQKAHPDVPLINMYFEDLKKNPVGSVQKLAEFLKLDVPQTLYADIAEACSFSKLKKVDESFKEGNPAKHLFKGDNPKLYRKGEVGDWKNYFTVALSEKFDQVVAEKLKDSCFKFQYAL